ncbi:hypothetical protein [Pseudomonas sp.]|uniref:hypothetical protein n=1 Tax=Pseudomonas sp. TaxID=306 RepID=UPI002618FEEE|nr:hypothetical protein [Pseudomonas sp.]
MGAGARTYLLLSRGRAALSDGRLRPLHEAGAGEPDEAEAIKNGECTGTVAAPGAAGGKLCVFIQGHNLSKNLSPTLPAVIENPGTGTGPAANPAGATVLAEAETEGEPMSALGTWAVTAP